MGLIAIFTGLRVTRDTTLQLMDTMLDRESIVHLRNAALTVPGVRAVEKRDARKTACNTMWIWSSSCIQRTLCGNRTRLPLRCG